MEHQVLLTDEIAINPQEWQERLTSYFHDTGYCPSSKRRAVAMALGEQTTYTDADTLWLSMRGQKIQVSRATVYKALIWLVDAGFVHKKDDGHRTYLYSIQ